MSFDLLPGPGPADLLASRDSLRRWLVEVAAPMMTGGALYVCGRSEELLMFGWARALGAGSVLLAVREAALPLATRLPSWVLYSLPDALWAFALIAMMRRCWNDRFTRASAPWLALALLTAVGSEIGQAVQIVPGTFDCTDLMLIVIACALSMARLNVRSPSLHPAEPI